MINRLRITDFAIIEFLDIEFSGGFNVLTGETGAGKSIIVDALGLLLGERASQELIKTGKKAALVEGEFTIRGNQGVGEILTDHGWELTDELIIGREISRSGKSQAFINGRMVPVSFLQKLGKELVDIHGQHDHQSLLSTVTQREFLDQFGHLEPDLREISESYAHYQDLKQEFCNVEQSRIERARQIDLLKYQLTEIEQTKISDPEEWDRLIQDQNRHVNAEKLSTASQQTLQELFENENSVFDRISSIRAELSALDQYDTQFGEWAKMLETLAYQIQELAESCREYSGQIEFDPERLEDIQMRLESLRTLQKKYGPSLRDVLQFYQESEQKLHELESLDEQTQSLHSRLHETGKRLAANAHSLSEKRKQTGKKLSVGIEKILGTLGMPKCRFEIYYQPDPDPVWMPDGFLSDRFTAAGYDLLEFRISPNPDENLKPLSKVASGGELSRIMLALKNLLAKHDRIPCMVFDEIDQGIGGPTAEIVGKVMQSVASSRQVLCITHLAQIAFQADRHLLVQKITGDRKTKVHLLTLTDTERVDELARMMGGIKTSDEIKRYAEQLLHGSKKKLQ